MDQFIEKRTCLRCKKKYQPTARCQKYCGTQKIKGSCSYIIGIEKHNAVCVECNLGKGDIILGNYEPKDI